MQSSVALDTRAVSRRGLLLITLAAVLWGTVGIASKALYQISDTNALSIGFFRLALSVPALLLMSWSMLRHSALRVTRPDLAWMGLIGFAMAMYQVSYFAAIPRVGVTITVLVALCTAPVIVALLSSVLLRERLTQRVLLALACALGGTVLLVGVPDDVAARQHMLVGVLLALGAALSYSTVVLSSRALSGRYHPLQPITIGFGFGALVLLPFALATGLVVNYSPAGWGLLLHLGLVPTALGYILFFAGIRSTTATVASIATLVEPLTSAFLAWLLFDERLGPSGLLGAVLLLGAMVILYGSGRAAE